MFDINNANILVQILHLNVIHPGGGTSAGGVRPTETYFWRNGLRNVQSETGGLLKPLCWYSVISAELHQISHLHVLKLAGCGRGEYPQTYVMLTVHVLIYLFCTYSKQVVYFILKLPRPRTEVLKLLLTYPKQCWLPGQSREPVDPAAGLPAPPNGKKRSHFWVCDENRKWPFKNFFSCLESR